MTDAEHAELIRRAELWDRVVAMAAQQHLTDCLLGAVLRRFIRDPELNAIEGTS